MKKLILLAVVALLGLSSCKKDNPDEGHCYTLDVGVTVTAPFYVKLDVYDNVKDKLIYSVDSVVYVGDFYYPRIESIHQLRAELVVKRVTQDIQWYGIHVDADLTDTYQGFEEKSSTKMYWYTKHYIAYNSVYRGTFYFPNR